MNSNFTAIIRFPEDAFEVPVQPPLNGYGPQIKAGNAYTSCVIHSSTEEAFKFNKDYKVDVSLRFPEHLHHFSNGMTIEFYEGSIMTGTGKITEMLPSL